MDWTFIETSSTAVALPCDMCSGFEGPTRLMLLVCCIMNETCHLFSLKLCVTLLRMVFWYAEQITDRLSRRAMSLSNYYNVARV